MVAVQIGVPVNRNCSPLMLLQEIDLSQAVRLGARRSFAPWTTNVCF